jgi:hypothetical protein
MRTDGPFRIHAAAALAPPALVSQQLDYAALAPSSRMVDGPVGKARVLDEVGAAVNLAYHARDLCVWRDIVLLSRLLAGLDAAARARFDAWIAAERRDGLRLSSAVAAADAIARDTRVALGCQQRYLAWVAVREDLPRSIVHADPGKLDRPRPGAQTRLHLCAARHRRLAGVLDSQSRPLVADRTNRAPVVVAAGRAAPRSIALADNKDDRPRFRFS